MRIFTSWRTWDDARAALPVDPAALDDAAAAALAWHGDQTRPTGVPYVEHLLEALEAQAVGAGVTDHGVLAATLLHDVVEDTSATVSDVEARFGADVAELVDWVTKSPATGPGRQAKRAAKAAYLRRLRDAPPRAVQVKLADRISNVQRLEQMPPDFQRRYYAETVTYVLPLAPPGSWYADWYAEWARQYAHLR